MTTHDLPSQRTGTLLAEDVILALFDPASGTIGGENTLFYVLGGAALADLAQQGRAEIQDAAIHGDLIRGIGDAPDDALLRPAWEYIVTKPRGVQGALAAAGPALRAPLLDRLVERGDLVRTRTRALGIFPTTTLAEGSTGRRATLITAMRAALVDGEQPTDRIGALIALVSASGALPTLHREIPWTGATATRAKQFEQRDAAAGAAAEAVTRTMIAVITNALVAGAVTAHR